MQTELSFLWDLYNQIQTTIDRLRLDDMDMHCDYSFIQDKIKSRIDVLLETIK